MDDAAVTATVTKAAAAEPAMVGTQAPSVQDLLQQARDIAASHLGMLVIHGYIDGVNDTAAYVRRLDALLLSKDAQAGPAEVRCEVDDERVRAAMATYGERNPNRYQMDRMRTAIQAAVGDMLRNTLVAAASTAPAPIDPDSQGSATAPVASDPAAGGRLFGQVLQVYHREDDAHFAHVEFCEAVTTGQLVYAGGAAEASHVDAIGYCRATDLPKLAANKSGALGVYVASERDDIYNTALFVRRQQVT